MEIITFTCITKVGSKHTSEAAIQRGSYEKVFLKYAANFQENTMPKYDFNKVAKQLY